jgi:hypothetical protein
MAGLDFVSVRIIAAIAVQSLRRCASSMAPMNFDTLAPVTLVFSSAMEGL